MQATAGPCNDNSTGSHHRKAGQYRKVFDVRKRRIRGLWERNGRFYAQIAVEDSNTGKKKVRRVPLEDAKTVPQAVIKLQDFLRSKRDKSLPILRLAPKFADYAEEYFAYHAQAKDAKRSSTLETERVAIRHWTAHLGRVRVHQIIRPMVNASIGKRQALGRSARAGTTCVPK